MVSDGILPPFSPLSLVERSLGGTLSFSVLNGMLGRSQLVVIIGNNMANNYEARTQLFFFLVFFFFKCAES